MDHIVQTSKGPVVDLRWLFEVAASWCWIVLPAVPLAFGLRAWRRTPGIRREETALLLLAGASWAWLLLGFFVPLAIGPSYDTRRYATILANLGAMLVLVPWAAVRARTLRRHVVLAALATAGVWLCVLVVSSVV